MTAQEGSIVRHETGSGFTKPFYVVIYETNKLVFVNSVTFVDYTGVAFFRFFPLE